MSKSKNQRNEQRKAVEAAKREILFNIRCGRSVAMELKDISEKGAGCAYLAGYAPERGDLFSYADATYEVRWVDAKEKQLCFGMMRCEEFVAA